MTRDAMIAIIHKLANELGVAKSHPMLLKLDSRKTSYIRRLMKRISFRYTIATGHSIV